MRRFSISISMKIIKAIRPKLVLTILFLILLGFEVYVLYFNVYGNLSTGVEDISVDTNIVRLDLKNYEKMLQLLDNAKAYGAPAVTVDNPFD